MARLFIPNVWSFLNDIHIIKVTNTDKYNDCLFWSTRVTIKFHINNVIVPGNLFIQFLQTFVLCQSQAHVKLYPIIFDLINT